MSVKLSMSEPWPIRKSASRHDLYLHATSILRTQEEKQRQSPRTQKKIKSVTLDSQGKQKYHW